MRTITNEAAAVSPLKDFNYFNHGKKKLTAPSSCCHSLGVDWKLQKTMLVKEIRRARD